MQTYEKQAKKKREKKVGTCKMNLTKPYFTSVCNSALHSESGLVKGVTSWEWISNYVCMSESFL